MLALSWLEVSNLVDITNAVSQIPPDTKRATNIIRQAKWKLISWWKSYSRRCLLRWTTSGCSSDARLSTLTVVDSSPTVWQLADNSDSWRLHRSLSREWLLTCRQTRCHVSSRQLRTICFSTSNAAVRSSMNRWYCCSTCEHELTNISYKTHCNISVMLTCYITLHYTEVI